MGVSDAFTKWAMSRLVTWQNLVKAESLEADEYDEDTEITYKKMDASGTVTTATTHKRQDILNEVKNDLSLCEDFKKPAFANGVPAVQLMEQGLGETIEAMQRVQDMYELSRKDFYDQAEIDAKTVKASQVQAYQMMAGFNTINDQIMKPLDEKMKLA